mgnify:CR=1 FL=1
MAETYDFQRYLRAKVALDDRSLNACVVAALRAAWPDGQLVRVLEIGAGVGTMVARLVRWGVLTGTVAYTAVDSDAANMAGLRALAASLPNGVRLNAVAADVYDFAAAGDGQYDVLIAHAVLDLLDLDRALPLLDARLADGGLAWLTLNFDGVTAFAPALDPALDAQIEALYHASMDARATGGHSQTGRRLFGALRQAGWDVLAAGSSDWVVHPVAGGYPGDEAYFLRHILHFVETTLGGHPALDSAVFGQWLAARRAQIAAGELLYVAHQIDYLAQKVGLQ